MVWRLAVRKIIFKRMEKNRDGEKQNSPGRIVKNLFFLRAVIDIDMVITILNVDFDCVFRRH